MPGEATMAIGVKYPLHAPSLKVIAVQGCLLSHKRLQSSVEATGCILKSYSPLISLLFSSTHAQLIPVKQKETMNNEVQSSSEESSLHLFTSSIA